MFSIDSLREFMSKRAAYLDDLENKYKEVITEAPAGKLTDLDEIERSLEGSPSPYIRRDLKTGTIMIYLGVEHPTEPQKYSFTLAVSGFSRSEEILNIQNYSLFNGIRIGDFMPRVTLSPQASANDERNVVEVMNQADSERIFRVHYNEVLRMIQTYLPSFSRALSKLRVRIVRNGTLSVGFDTDLKMLFLHINPGFILKCATVDYINNKDKFRSLRACYVYTAAFFLAHEIMHIMRHTASLLDREAFENVSDDHLGHILTNIILDNYINVYLSKIFRNEVGGGKVHFAGEGVAVSGEVLIASSVISSSLPPQFHPINKVFKAFKSPKVLLETIGNVFKEVLKFEKEINYGYGSLPGTFPADWKTYENAAFVMKFSCYNMGLFEGNSANYAKSYNKVIKSITKEIPPELKKRPEEKKPEEKKREPEEQESLVGREVKEKATGKRGIVVEDDLKGNVKVFFPKEET